MGQAEQTDQYNQRVGTTFLPLTSGGSREALQPVYGRGRVVKGRVGLLGTDEAPKHDGDNGMGGPTPRASRPEDRLPCRLVRDAEGPRWGNQQEEEARCLCERPAFVVHLKIVEISYRTCQKP